MDPRISLKNELLLIGISSNDSTIIALDAGSSQITIAREYFEEYKYSDNIIEKAFNIVLQFYKVKLYTD